MNAIIVEDDQLVGQFIAYVLECEGFSAEIYPSGEDVEYPVIARIAVIDLVLPGISGLCVADRIRESAPNVPLVFVTGTTDPHNIRLMLGYTDYIVTKPFTELRVSELRKAVKSIKGVH